MYSIYKLFHSYCTSYYGCELWQLSNPNISFCVAWRKGLRRIWKLPSNSHCILLPIISHCLPIFDELSSYSLHRLLWNCTRSQLFAHRAKRSVLSQTL